MKKVILFVILISVCQVECSLQVIKNGNQLIADSINGILEGYFEPRESKVDLIYYGARGGSSEKIVEAILQSKTSGVSVKVMRVPPENIERIQANISSIHIFDSNEIFWQNKERINWLSNPNRRCEQLIYIPGISSSSASQIFAQDNSFVNINFIILQTENSNTVELVGKFGYSSVTGCDAPRFKKINRFIGNPPRWENSSFFPKLFLNFYGCPLIVGKYITQSDNKMLRYIFLTLAQHLNFQPFLPDDPGASFDIDLRYAENNFHQLVGSSTSVVVEDEKLVFFIPPGKPYTQLEKMFLMFEVEVWIAIGATFVITLGIIQVINHMAIKVRAFVYGRNITAPTLNFLNIFFNGAQARVPGRNFARFILILFVVWSLVIRTCYQSTLFKLLQTDLRKPRCETIDQLIRNNFTLIYRPNSTEYVLGPELMAKFEKQEKMENREDFWKDLNIDYAFVALRNFFTNEAKKDYRGKEVPVYMLAEEIRSAYMSVFFPKFLPFFERFNELIDRMVMHGLTRYRNNNLISNDRFEKPESPEPKALTLEHIGIGFVIVLVLLVLSVVVFLLELIYHKFHTYRLAKQQQFNNRQRLQNLKLLKLKIKEDKDRSS